MIIPDWYLIYSLLKEQKKLQEEEAAQMDSIRPERDVTPTDTLCPLLIEAKTVRKQDKP